MQRKRQKNLSSIEATGKCLCCGSELPRTKSGEMHKRRKYCNDDCSHKYYMDNHYNYFKYHIKKERKRCESCGTTKNLHVHHRVPVWLGGKICSANNVRVLCKQCHRKEHMD